MTINERKKRLIKEGLQKSEAAMSGMRTVLFSVLTVIVLRLAFLLYELIYFSSADVKISVISELLLLPLMLVLYMVYDGNRGLASVTFISAAVRIIYLFADVYSTLPKGTGANIYMAVYIAVMAVQIILSVLLTTSKRCGEYFALRQRVNMQIRNEMLKK